MIIYFIDKTSLKIKEVITATNFSLNIDEETNSTSTINLHKKPNATEGDFIIAKNESKTEYQGIITEIQGEKNSNAVTINCEDISNLFNRKVYVYNLSLMDTSLEDFLYYTINKFFKTGDGDTHLAMSYLSIVQQTQTAVTEPLNDEDGVYNFHTFMTNCRQNKNISVDFEIDQEELTVTISNKGNQSEVKIDTTNSDVVNYNKVYETSITSKVTVLCGDTGNTLNYYLLTDRTISTNIDDPNRAEGEVETIYVDQETKAQEQAQNIFSGNRYNHLVEFEIKADSQLVDRDSLTIGRKIKIKTEDGILDSYISSIVKEETSNYIKYKSGNIRINLIDKLHQEPYKVGINKQDKLISSTNIKTINNNSILGSGNISIPCGDVDYIVEQGTSGEWTYRKWNSGNIELWGNHQFSGISVTSSSAGTYYGSAQTLSVPLVTSITTANANAHSSLSSGTFIHGLSISGTSLKFDIRRWQSGTNINLGAGIYVFGKWK